MDEVSRQQLPVRPCYLCEEVEGSRLTDDGCFRVVVMHSGFGGIDMKAIRALRGIYKELASDGLKTMSSPE
jgi:hypothetical protein